MAWPGRTRGGCAPQLGVEHAMAGDMVRFWPAVGRRQLDSRGYGYRVPGWRLGRTS